MITPVVSRSLQHCEVVVPFATHGIHVYVRPGKTVPEVPPSPVCSPSPRSCCCHTRQAQQLLTLMEKYYLQEATKSKHLETPTRKVRFPSDCMKIYLDTFVHERNRRKVNLPDLMFVRSTISRLRNRPALNSRLLLVGGDGPQEANLQKSKTRRSIALLHLSRFMGWPPQYNQLPTAQGLGSE